MRSSLAKHTVQRLSSKRVRQREIRILVGPSCVALRLVGELAPAPKSHAHFLYCREATLKTYPGKTHASTCSPIHVNNICLYLAFWKSHFYADYMCA